MLRHLSPVKVHSELNWSLFTVFITINVQCHISLRHSVLHNGRYWLHRLTNVPVSVAVFAFSSPQCSPLWVLFIIIRYQITGDFKVSITWSTSPIFHLIGERLVFLRQPMSDMPCRRAEYVKFLLIKGREMYHSREQWVSFVMRNRNWDISFFLLVTAVPSCWPLTLTVTCRTTSAKTKSHWITLRARWRNEVSSPGWLSVLNFVFLDKQALVSVAWWQTGRCCYFLLRWMSGGELDGAPRPHPGLVRGEPISVVLAGWWDLALISVMLRSWLPGCWGP